MTESERTERRTRKPRATESTTTLGYEVRVTIDNLNIRTGPGRNHVPTGKFTGQGIFKIVETVSGVGSTNGWGKLADGRGWISLDYTERV